MSTSKDVLSQVLELTYSGTLSAVSESSTIATSIQTFKLSSTVNSQVGN